MSSLLPWNEGGREDTYERAKITMSHDELRSSLPPESVKMIDDAGFVLVPKSWRDNALESLSKRCRENV